MYNISHSSPMTKTTVTNINGGDSVTDDDCGMIIVIRIEFIQ
jgi:hypothetical protein